MKAKTMRENRGGAWESGSNKPPGGVERRRVVLEGLDPAHLVARTSAPRMAVGLEVDACVVGGGVLKSGEQRGRKVNFKTSRALQLHNYPLPSQVSTAPALHQPIPTALKKKSEPR
jgi:hypothetical protein